MFRLECIISYGLEQVWYVTAMKRSNIVAVGHEEGSIVIELECDEAQSIGNFCLQFQFNFKLFRALNTSK